MARAFELAVKAVGAQTVFFTHTIEAAAFDKYYEESDPARSVPLGHYIRELFLSSMDGSQSTITPEMAGDAARWMIEGRHSEIDGRPLPQFDFMGEHGRDHHYSPANFVISLAHRFGGRIVAVSRDNARTAGKEFTDAGFLDKTELDPDQGGRPIEWATNAVDRLFFGNPKLNAVMNLREMDPAKRRTENILDPSDPKAWEIYTTDFQRPYPEDLKNTPPVISDEELTALWDSDHKQMLDEVRRLASIQYPRNIRFLQSRLAAKNYEGDEEAWDVDVNRLRTLETRWIEWTGQPFPVGSVEAVVRNNIRERLKAREAAIAKRIAELKRIARERPDPTEPWPSELNAKFYADQASLQKVQSALGFWETNGNDGRDIGEVVQALPNLLDEDRFTVVFARRIVDYKRMLLVVFGEHLPAIEELLEDRHPTTDKQFDEILKELMAKAGKANIVEFCSEFVSLLRDHNEQFIFAGPTFDNFNRSMVKLLDRTVELIAAEHVDGKPLVPDINRRVVYVEGYTPELSPFLVRGARLWLNNPRLFREASGTSGMKVLILLSMLDGFWRDGNQPGLAGMYVPIPKSPRPDNPHYWSKEEKTSRPGEVLEYLRQEAQSLYAELARAPGMAESDPKEWLRLVRRTIFHLATVYEVHTAMLGRYIPSSAAGIKSGRDPGIYDFYTRSIETMEAGARRLEALAHFHTLKDRFAFVNPTDPNVPSSRPLVSAGAWTEGSPEPVGVRAAFRVDASVSGDVDLFLRWWKEGQNPHQDHPFGQIRFDATTGVHHGETKLSLPSETGAYGMTVYARPRNGDGADGDLLLFSARYPGDDVRIVRERPQVWRDKVQGASGLFQNSGLSLRAVGAVEGFLTAVVGLVMTGVLAAFVPGSESAAVLPTIFSSAAGRVFLGVLSSVPATVAVRILLRSLHEWTGVMDPFSRTPSFDARRIRGATRTASISLPSIPLLGIALQLSGEWRMMVGIAAFVWAVGSHAWSNPPVTLTTQERHLAADLGKGQDELRAALRSGDQIWIGRAIEELAGAVENLDLLHFSQRPRADADTHVVKAFRPVPLDFNGRNGEWGISKAFVYNALQTNRAGLRAASLGDIVAGRPVGVEAPAERRGLNLIVSSDDGDVGGILARATSAVRALEAGGEVTLVLRDAAETLAETVSSELRNRRIPVRVVRESQINSSGDIETLLLRPAIEAGQRVALLMDKSGRISDRLLGHLVEASRAQKYHGLVTAIFIETVTAEILRGLPAVEMEIDGVDAEFKFRALAKSHA